VVVYFWTATNRRLRGALWSIIAPPFIRENLEWAVVVPGDDEMSPAVTQLLRELSARGITVYYSQLEHW
jgi:hypothetical protein